MKRSGGILSALVWLCALPGPSAVKIAGVEFVPKDLVFAVAEAKSRAVAEGPLPDECKWSFTTETRIGRREEAQGCIRFYYRTTVTLVELRGERYAPEAPLCRTDHGHRTSLSRQRRPYHPAISRCAVDQQRSDGRRESTGDCAPA